VAGYFRCFCGHRADWTLHVGTGGKCYDEKELRKLPMFQRSPLFTALLLLAIFVSFIFFVSIGCAETIINLSKWSEDFKTCSIQSVKIKEKQFAMY
jgi:hypothetical protein